MVHVHTAPCVPAISIHRKSLTPALVASYCPNGPTFAVPRNWSEAVLSEGGQIRQGTKATVGRSLRQKLQIQPLKLHQSAVTCDGDGFRAAENVQLREDVAQVPFHHYAAV